MIYSHESVDLPDKTAVTISIRPENIEISASRLKEKNILKAKVVTKTFVGNYIDYRVAVKEEVIRVQDFNTDISYAEGEEIYLCINPDKVTILPEKLEIEKDMKIVS